jgi:hypothetical protein
VRQERICAAYCARPSVSPWVLGSTVLQATDRGGSEDAAGRSRRQRRGIAWLPRWCWNYAIATTDEETSASWPRRITHHRMMYAGGRP